MPIEFDSPESSLIEWARYVPGPQSMIVRFKTGSRYVYQGISPELWLEFYQSHSKGQFFGQRIRPMYAGTPSHG